MAGANSGGVHGGDGNIVGPDVVAAEAAGECTRQPRRARLGGGVNLKARCPSGRHLK